MARESLVLMILVGLAFNFEVSFSEYNFMQYSDGQNSQFAYIKPEYLAYENTLVNSINTLNEIKSDLMFLMDYSRNKNFGTYLNSKKVLEEHLNLSLKYYKGTKGEEIKSFLDQEGGIKGCGFFKELLGSANPAVPAEEEKLKEFVTNLKSCKMELKKTASDLLKKKKEGRINKEEEQKKEEEKKKEEKAEEEEENRLDRYYDVIKYFEYLWEKSYTLEHSSDLFLSKAGGEKYRFLAIDKKCGTLIQGKKVLDSSKYPSPECQFKDSEAGEVGMLLSNVVIYNKEKLELVSEKIWIGEDSDSTIVTIGDKIEGDDQIYPKVFSVVETGTHSNYNFVVFLLKYIEPEFDNSQNERGLIFIATHFDSKKEEFDARQKMGESISQVVNDIKKKLPKWDVIFSGDLNAEIGEIAKNLNEPIFRLEDQMVENFGYKIQSIHTPQDFSIDSLGQRTEALRVMKQFKEFKNDVCKNLNVFQRMKVLGFDLNSGDEVTVNVKEVTDFESPYLKFPSYLNKEHNFNDFWIELNNFPTELKVRVNQIDYSEEGFDTCIVEEALMNIVKGDENMKKASNSLIESAMGKKIFDMAEKGRDIKKDKEGKKDLSPIFKSIDNNQDLFNLFRFAKYKWRAERKKVLLNYLEAKANSLNWVASTTKAEDCFTRLFEKEKLNFVLFKPYSKVISVKVVKMNDFNKQLEVGFPNKNFASDHVPTQIKLSFDLEKKFNLETSIFLDEVESSQKLI